VDEDAEALNRSLVGRLSPDHRTFTGRKRNCLTAVRVNPDGTLSAANEWVKTRDTS